MIRRLRRLLARKPWRPSARLRLRADAERRAGRNAEAVALYRDYLRDRPDDAVGWCMLAHCLRVQGLWPEADAAYARATAEGPDNPDAQLYRARFLFDTGQEAAMLPFAQRALALGATPARLREACGEFSLGLEPAADARAEHAALWIDVSDLLIYLRDNRNLSGIHRVVTALLQQAVAEPGRLACVMTRPWGREVWALSPGAIAALPPLIEAGQGATPPMRAAIAAVVRGARPAIPRPGQRYLQPGGFWVGEGSPPLHAALRRAGALEFLLLYDLIPLTHPQSCMRQQVELFTGTLGEALLGAHGLLAISRHTAAEVAALIEQRGLPPRPIAVTPLAHGIRPEAAGAAWPAALADLAGRRFVLAVGTIEQRKNHAFLVRLWERLRAAGVQPPVLVLAGKPGWDITELETALAENPEVAALVRIMPSLPDAALEALYQSCLFTALPSLTEGWGLPIGEAMARGKLCVTADRGSMPEVGEGHALLIDPEDVEAAAPVFRRLIEDDAWRTALEHDMAAQFRPRDWPEVAANIVSACLEMPIDPAEAAIPPRPRLPAGLRHAPAPLLGAHARPWALDPVAHPLRLMLAEGWRPPQPNGSDMAGPEAWVHLRTDAPGTLHLAFAALRDVRLAAAGQEARVPANGHGMLRIPLPAGGHSIRLTASMDDMPEGTLPWVRLVSVELRAG